MNAQQKIISKVEHDVNGGCWLWAGALSKEGYGVAYDPDSKKTTRAHRLSYRVFKGPLIEGLVLDHKCRVRSCVNPDHLRQVTSAENVLCGIGPTAQNAIKTHCPKGHEYQGDYLVTLRGWRQCRVCRFESNARMKEKLKRQRRERGLQRKPHTNYPRANKVSHLLEPTAPTDVDGEK